MIQTILDAWPLVTTLTLLFSSLFSLYLLLQLTKVRRQLEDSEKQRKHTEELLETASRALRQRAKRLELGTEAPQPRQ